MEALDNPSYFSLPASTARTARCHTSSLPRPNMGMVTSSPVNHPPPRRSFRSLLRSLSGPTPPIRGQPLHVLSKTPSVSSDVSECETDFGSNDMMYYNVPSPPNPAGSRDEPPPRYYHNLTEGGRRRHSIGAFFRPPLGVTSPLGRLDVNANVAAGKLEQPLRRPSTERWLHGARRRASKSCHGKVSRSLPGTPVPPRSAGEMDDILIVSYQHSQVANMWVSYLTSCFEQICKQRNRPPFRVLCVGLEDVGAAVPLALEERIVRVKLQLVVMCPQFLEHIQEQPGPGAALARLLQPDRVLAMLLGVDEASVTEQHRAALISFQQWKRLPVRNRDEGFVGEFLNEAMAVLARVTLEQQVARQDRASFSVLPKKVKHGHNKVIVLLNEPLVKDDKVKVTVNKNGEILEVSSVKKRNPFTLHFSMPDACLAVSMLVGVRVEKNGEALGVRQVKCESKMRELDQLLRSSDSPLDFMCQTLGFSLGDREQLDSFLVTAFQRNLPPHFSLFTPPSVHDTPHKSANSPEELPTLLHFAARFGLEKLAWQLVECPGGEQACEVRNGSDLSPADIAESAGHSKLAAALRGYMQMNEFTSMYCYLKMAAEGNNKSGSIAHEEVDYHRPRPLSETYQVPPAARPLTLLTQTSAPSPSSTPDDTGGYLEMHPSRGGYRSPSVSSMGSSLARSPMADKELPRFGDPFTSLPRGTTPPTPSRRLKDWPPSSESPSSRSSDEEPIKAQSASSTSKSPSSRGDQQSVPVVTVQDELVEIISDFKNNVFTISEVEKLVENWKNRNDVQQSFKEKQEQLNHMREQYDRLQQKMKDDMKRPTPFDRIRKFFSGSKSKGNKEVAVNGADDRAHHLHPDRTPDLGQRPPSSLSLHSICSSSSSERMSTMSACSGTSLGDSGTHSDPEDRKTLPPLREPLQIPEESPENSPRSSGGGINCYEVPPAPRPVMEARNKPKLSCLVNNNGQAYMIDNRPPLPQPRDLYEDDTDPYYISPGSLNMPGSKFTFNEPPSSPSVNITEAPPPQSPDYMNLAPPSNGDLPSYINLEPEIALPPRVPPRVPPRHSD